LTIGTGTSKLNTNGRIFFQAGPESPFKNDGVFNLEGAGFMYSSGTLEGKGSFVVSPTATLNLTGSASRTISTTVIVNGKAITETDRSTSLVLTKGGDFIVAGTFTANKDLSISVDTTSAFSVKPTGMLIWTGANLNFEGNAFTIAAWSLGSGVATFDNGIISGSLNVAGGTLQLIGGPTDKRSFDKITGTGTIINLGGVNTFNILAASNFAATGGNASIANGTIGTLSLGGSYLLGGKIMASAASLSSGFICGGLEITVTSLVLEGVVSVADDNTMITPTGTTTITKTSQLTFTHGSSLRIPSTAQVMQNAAFTIVEGAPTPKSPSVVIDGRFTSGAAFAVSTIAISGSGSFFITSAGSWNLNNVKFDASSLSSSGAVSLSVGSFTVAAVTGTGSFTGNPSLFSVTSVTASSFTLNSGNVRFDNITLTTLTLNNGNFGIMDSATITNLNFIAGKLFGTNGDKQVPVKVSKTVISGAATQTLNNIALTSSAISVICPLQSNCQLFTSNSVVSTA